MIIPDDADLDLTLNFRIDDLSYAIFVTTGKVKCFGCGNMGHLILNCLNKNTEREEGNKNRSADQGSEDNDRKESQVEAQEVDCGKECCGSSFRRLNQYHLRLSKLSQILNVLSAITDSSVSDTLVSPSEGKKESTNGEKSQFSVMGE